MSVVIAIGSGTGSTSITVSTSTNTQIFVSNPMNESLDTIPRQERLFAVLFLGTRSASISTCAWSGSSLDDNRDAILVNFGVIITITSTVIFVVVVVTAAIVIGNRFKGPLQVQHLVGQQPNGKDIGLFVVGLPPGHLRTHVPRRSHLFGEPK